MPVIAQVTRVWLPSGWNVNFAWATPSIGLKNSSLMPTSSPGRDSVTVIRPVPAWLLPAHA